MRPVRCTNLKTTYVKRGIDKEYFDAIERGDMETAQRIVDQQAVSKGYIPASDYRMMHQAPNKGDYNV